jgi:hypothetical protein
MQRAKCVDNQTASVPDPNVLRKPNENQLFMTIMCSKCRGVAAPAAQMKTFEFNGQILHCLELVSSCMVCGHHWADETYDVENSHNVEQACLAARGVDHWGSG